MYNFFAQTLFRRYRLLIGIVFGAVLFAVIFLRIDIKVFREQFASGDTFILLLALLPIFLAHIFSTFRWKTFLDIAGYHLPFSRLFTAFFANLPAAKFFHRIAGIYCA